jgi:prevent-host-death family protein
MLLLPKTTTINAMDLRREAGTLLDRADYRRESFVIERAGKPKAVLVPYTEFKQLQRIRQEARTRYFESVEELQDKFSDLSSENLEKLIEEAVQNSRSS